MIRLVKPSSNVSIKIHNPNRDGHGELWLKGNNVMDGYLYPKGLKDAFVDGYFKTGILRRLIRMDLS